MPTVGSWGGAVSYERGTPVDVRGVCLVAGWMPEAGPCCESAQKRPPRAHRLTSASESDAWWSVDFENIVSWSGDTTLCKVTLVILHGYVSGVTLYRVVSPE